MNVYEHGIVSEEVLKGTSLRRLATADLPIYSGLTTTVLDFEGNSLNERNAKIVRTHPEKPCWSADYYEESDLRHCTSSMLYHLDRILQLYVGVTQLFEEHYKVVTEGNTGDQRIFFEVEAFFDCARRVYDTIRKVLWKHYGRGQDRWTTIFTVPKNPHHVPKEFVAILKQSFLDFGNNVKAYRDCVAHCDPLHDGATTCWTSGFEGRWGTTIRLPENPRATNRNQYQFEKGPDALSYCHSVACHLVELCEHLSALEDVQKHLNHPELGRGWLQSMRDNAHLHPQVD